MPRVEIELVFVLGKPLKGPGVGLLDVLRATEYVVPAIEIIDARVQNPRKIFDTVADNGAAAGIVIGGRPVGPMDIDLRWVERPPLPQLRNRGDRPWPPACSGTRRSAIAWLANKVGAFGTVLEPGHLMLSGSFIRPVWANPGRHAARGFRTAWQRLGCSSYRSAATAARKRTFPDFAFGQEKTWSRDLPSCTSSWLATKRRSASV